MRLGRLYFRKLRTSIAFAGGAIAASIIAIGAFAIAAPSYDRGSAEPAEISQVEPAQQIYESLQIMANMAISRMSPQGFVKPGGVDEVIYTDGRRQITLTELKARGYSHKRYTDCYHEFTDRAGNVIPASCAEPDTNTAT